MSRNEQKLLKDVISKVSKVVDFNTLQTYPRANNPNEQQRGDSFQVLIQIIISLRTTLENEILAANRLFSEYSTPQEIIDASPDKIADLIRPAGMPQKKTKTIVTLCHEIQSRYQGNIDQLRDLPPEEARMELMSLPGVGPKSADCMLELGFGIPYLPVDVNVDRVSRRLEFVSQKATKEDIRTTLESLLPKDIDAFIEAHTFLLALGKYYCKARPLCYQCPVVELCPFEDKNLRDK